MSVAVAGPKTVDNKGFTPDSKCGNCQTEFPISVYSEGCPACESGAVQTFLTKNVRVGVVGLGGPLPVSLWEKRVLSGVCYLPPASPGSFSNLPIDNKGFTPDSRCGYCHKEFPVAVYSDSCPVCGSRSIKSFLFKGPGQGIAGIGCLPISLWEKRERLDVNYNLPGKRKTKSNGNRRSQKVKNKIRRRGLKLRAD